jgi:hypothetical protein
VTDPERLARIGRILYSDQWQVPLAAGLGINDRTVRRWAAGKSPIPESRWAEIKALGKRRSTEIQKAIAAL